MPAKKSKGKHKSDVLNKNQIRHPSHHLQYSIYSIYAAVILLFVAYHLYYADKIVPGVKVNGTDIGGVTTEMAVNKLRDTLLSDSKINIFIGDKYTKEVKPEDIEFHFLPIKTVQNSYAVGRHEEFFDSLKHKLTGFFAGVNIPAEYSYDTIQMLNVLNTIKREAGISMQESHFEFKDGKSVIIKGNEGLTFDEAQLEETLLARMQSNDSSEIRMELVNVSPQLTIDDLDKVKPDLDKMLEKKYAFKYNDRSWEISPEQLLTILEPKKASNGDMTLELNKMRLAQKLESIASEIDSNPKGQVLDVQNGRAVQFTSSADGLKLKLKESAEEAQKAIKEGNSEINLAVQVTKAPDINNEFGIEELIGTGSSKFKGSIPGRILNVGLAASRVNGVLVAPGDVFSFDESVGEISAKTGYSTAYVISQGRTVLGDGGGVCQVSTTVFRAALDAGLPIIERNAHSYRVNYYEQDSGPGIDATVYSPSVDLQFKNDTPSYILITSEFNANDATLLFKIYGKKDGRQVEISEPKITSRTPPPADIYEDDPTLAKGVKKQVEHAVWGATVFFTRKVTKDGQVLYNDTFKSNYRPWGNVYKVGTRE